eukprot:TRINITY_DN23750_c0_g1_i1.p1 TRINITY_DN23750_c0_g1~~TRINITY_DN23750_c0_g1_i1.p1  ORF type:complete len:4185 (-),score=632.85 TRINITY_DN23750_c0_g1_i1:7-12414(-)
MDSEQVAASLVVVGFSEATVTIVPAGTGLSDGQPMDMAPTSDVLNSTQDSDALIGSSSNESSNLVHVQRVSPSPSSMHIPAPAPSPTEEAGSSRRLVHIPRRLASLAIGSFCDLRLLGTVPQGTSNLTVPVDTDLQKFSHFLIHAASSLAEKTTPSSHLIFDMDASVSNVSFVDKDLDVYELGGDIYWAPPVDDSRVSDYVVDLSTDSRALNRSQIGAPVPVRTNATFLAAESPLASYTHILVFSRSLLTEQTTPVYLHIVDNMASVSNITFPDLDLDEFDLGGELSWAEPITSVGYSEVTHYLLYFATAERPIKHDVSNTLLNVSHDSDSVSLRWERERFFGINPVGMDSHGVPINTAIENFTHWLISTKSSLVEQTGRAWLQMFDAFASVSGVHITDKDLDSLELGGTVFWSEPATPERVSSYNLYLAQDPAGLGRSQVESSTPVGTNYALVPPETASGRYSFLAVYTASSLAEQTTPVAFEFVDRSSLVQNLTFPDFDLDFDDIGGMLVWDIPVDDSQVTQYDIYLVSIPKPADILASCSSMSTLNPFVFDDVTISLSSDTSEVAMNSDDITTSTLAGDVSNLTNDTSSSAYVQCLRSYYRNVSVVTHSMEIPTNIRLSPFTHWAVYARSVLAEQSTPVSLLIYDMIANVSNISFQGLDLDMNDLGGTVTWLPPPLMSRVHAYILYLAEDAEGSNRSQIGDPVPAGHNQLLVPAETPRASYTHHVVYTQSTLTEQTTPSYLAFIDEISQAANVSFIDDDLDRYELGGDLLWNRPEDDSEVTHYLIYLAEDRKGASRSLLGNVTVGTHIFSIPPETALLSFTHLTVYARSAMLEQTTPSSVIIVDISASVSGMFFVDKDLDLLELGGIMTWTPPHLGHVVGYRMYLATNASGADRSLVGSEVPKGTDCQYLPAETTHSPFSHLVVYTRSVLVEQTTPVSFELVDLFSQVSNITFPDFDLDATDLGGLISWTEPSDISQVTYYDVYMVEGVSGSASCTTRVNVTVNATASAVVAIVSGSLSFRMDGATKEQVEFAVKAALGNILVIDTAWLVVSVMQAPVRRLAGMTREQARRLALSTWLVSWQAVVALEKVATMVGIATAISSDPSSFVPALTSALVAAGVDSSAIVASLVVLSFDPPQVQVVSEEVGAALLGTSTTTTITASANMSKAGNISANASVDDLLNSDDLNLTFNSDGLNLSDLQLVLRRLSGSSDTSTLVPGSFSVDYSGAYVAEVNVNICIRDYFGNSSVHNPNLSVPPNTSLANYTHLAVYTRSSYVEQTTPTTHLIYDMIASVSDISFVDRDLDDGELGGRIYWVQPDLMERVYTYRLYLASDSVGSSRSFIGSDVASGTNLADLLPDAVTYPQIVVYTRSMLTEQTTPVGFTVEDNLAPVQGISFSDFDLDATDLGGTVAWEAPEDISQVEHYIVYLARMVHNSSDCGGPEDSAAAAVVVISGSFTFALQGATVVQVEASAKTALAEIFAVASDDLSVAVTQLQSRLLVAVQQQGARRLTSTWQVQYQAVAPLGRDADILSIVATINNDFTKLENSLNRALVTQGVDAGTVSASLAVLAFGPVIVYVVDAESVPPLAPTTLDNGRPAANVSFNANQIALSHMRNSSDFESNVSGSNTAQADALTTITSTPSTAALENVSLNATAAYTVDVPSQDATNTTTGTTMSATTTTTEDGFDLLAALETLNNESYRYDNSSNDSEVNFIIDSSDGSFTNDSADLTRDSDGNSIVERGDGHSTIASNGSNSTDASIESSDGNAISYSDADQMTRRLSAIDLSDAGSSSSDNLTFDATNATNRSDALDDRAQSDKPLVMCYRSYFGNVSNGTYNLTVPSGDTALKEFTHFLVYSSSTLAEQTTPVSFLIYDMIASVSNITYQGKDLDLRDLGGQIAWLEPPLMERVEQYNVYLSEGLDGSGKSQIGSPVPAGSSDISLIPDSPRANFNYFTVFTQSSLVEQTTPVYLSIDDEVSMARNVSFIDDDLDASDIGGYVHWRVPEDSSEVTSYSIYLAEDDAGENRSLLGNVTAGTHEFLIPADTGLHSYTHVTVYAWSSLAEQSTPSAVAIIDTISSVSAITFPDKDLDSTELGGWVSWTPPPSSSRVTYYELYLAESALGFNRLPYVFGSIPAGTNEALIPAETPKAAFTHLAVYTKSWLQEQSTPVAQEFEDKVSLVVDLNFPDYDLDQEDLGGTLAWLPPADVSQITHYMVYLGQANTSSGCSSTGYLDWSEPMSTDTYSPSGNASNVMDSEESDNTSAIFTDWCLLTYIGNSSVGTNKFFVQTDTTVPPYTHFVVFTASSLVEQTTPIAHHFFDEVASVSNISFVDQDLDPVDMGGMVYWEPPPSSSRVHVYRLYLAVEGAVPSDKSQIGPDVPVGTESSLMPAETQPLHYTRCVVFTKSTLVEQTTPVDFHFVDKTSPVLNVSFFDYDLDQGDLLGTICWNPPIDEDQVMQYNVYLAEDTMGKARSLIDFAMKDVHNVSVLPETSLLNHTRILVYTMSPLVEQTTPVSHLIFDALATVSGIEFEDRDLDPDEIGGNVTWIGPQVDDRVKLYLLYVANSATGIGRFRTGVDGEVPMLTHETKIAAETPIPGNSHLVIYTKSELIEQTTPGFHKVDDNVAIVPNISFPDLDLDTTDLGGELSWTVPEDNSLVTNFVIYFARDLTDGENSSDCPYDTPPPMLVAIIGGELRFMMDGVDPSQVAAAAKAFLAVVFGIPESVIFVEVISGFSTSGRRLATVWTVRYEFVVSPDLAWAIVLKSWQLNENLPMVQTALAAAFVAAKVDASALASLAVLSFAEVWLQQVPAERVQQYLRIPESAFDTWKESNDSDGNLSFNLSNGTLTRDLASPTSPPMNSSAASVRRLASASDNMSSARIRWCRRFYRTVQEYDFNITIPVETALEDFTHILIYTASTLVEQSWPTPHLIFDANATVSGIHWLDDDLDPLEFGGNVSWVAPLDSSRVSEYHLYLAQSSTGLARYRLRDAVPVGSNEDLVPENIQPGNHSYLTIYTRSSLVEQTTPAPFLLSDTVSKVPNISFPDLDLDYTDLGGVISWTPPEDEKQVTLYFIYLADDPLPDRALGDNGAASWTGRSQLGVVGVGNNELVIPAETPRHGYPYLLVYASSTLAEQTTPGVHLIYDGNASVSAISYIGKDLDLQDLGGMISWTAPAMDADRVTSYSVYLAEDEIGTARSRIGADVLAGANEILLPPETPRLTYVSQVVYTRSSLVEQTTPVSHTFFDTSSLPRNLYFLDLDLGRYDIGGNFTWDAPLDTSTVTSYFIYLAEDPYGKNRQYMGNTTIGTNDYFIPFYTDLVNFTHMLVYASSDLAEMTTPSAFLIKDSSSVIGNITLIDKDLDEDQVGGQITWDPPHDESIVQRYRVFFCKDPLGTARSQIDTDKLPPVRKVTFPPETDVPLMETIAVYITAFGFEQRTPSSVPFVDVVTSVSYVQFPDQDVDASEIGGTLSWGAPLTADMEYLRDYRVYFATSLTGAVRSPLFGVVPPGTNMLTIPAGTKYAGYGYLLVYTRSEMAEQTTPLGVQIYDQDGLITGVTFEDMDLDRDMLGGSIQWYLPPDTSAVLGYLLYFAFDAMGNGKTLFGGVEHLPTTSQVAFPLGTSIVSTLEIEVVTCIFTIADNVDSVFYDGVDITASVNGSLTAWTDTKSVSFRRVPGAFLAISGSSNLQSTCGGTGDVCIGGAGTVYGMDYCLVAGFQISCSDGVSTSSNWEAIGFSSPPDATSKTGAGLGWGGVCNSSTGAYMLENQFGMRIWPVGPDGTSGSRHAVFRLRSGPIIPTGNASFTHFLIYAKSALQEQTTPASLEIADGIVQVTRLRFDDTDIDRGQVGGELRWIPTGAFTAVSSYTAFLANSAEGADRTKLGEAIGTNHIILPQDTFIYNYSHVVVYVRSNFSEQRDAAASLEIWDEFDENCELIPNANCYPGTLPTGVCDPRTGCNDCDLNPTRQATVEAATAGASAIIASVNDKGAHSVMEKMAQCGMQHYKLQYYAASGSAAPQPLVPVVSICRYECRGLSGSEVCRSCVAPPATPPSPSSADSDGASVWRYLACRYRNIYNASGSDLAYSYVFMGGRFLGTGTEVAVSMTCDQLSMAATSVDPFVLGSMQCSSEDACSLSARDG